MKNPKTKMVMVMGRSGFRQVSVIAILGKYPWFPRNIYFDMSASVAFLLTRPTPLCLLGPSGRLVSIGSCLAPTSIGSPAGPSMLFRSSVFLKRGGADSKGDSQFLDGSAHGRLIVNLLLPLN